MSDATTPSSEISGSGQNYTSAPFKSASEPAQESKVTIPFEKPNAVTIGVTAPPKADQDIADYKAEHENIAHEFFKTDTPYQFLPEEVKSQLQTIDEYVDHLISEDGLKHTVSSYQNVLNKLLFDIVEGQELSLSEQIDMVSGFARNMMKLEGMNEIRDKIERQLKGKKTSKDMDSLVLKEIGRLII